MSDDRELGRGEIGRGYQRQQQEAAMKQVVTALLRDIDLRKWCVEQARLSLADNAPAFPYAASLETSQFGDMKVFEKGPILVMHEQLPTLQPMLIYVAEAIHAFATADVKTLEQEGES